MNDWWYMGEGMYFSKNILLRKDGYSPEAGLKYIIHPIQLSAKT
jgi:hypothetical protein